MKIYYNPDLKEKAKTLRQNATFSERVLWKRLRKRQLLGYQFMRQKPIDNYIVDFYCSKLGLVIEIDGISHNDKQQYDDKREKILKKLKGPRHEIYSWNMFDIRRAKPVQSGC